MIRRPPRSPLFPSPTLFRSRDRHRGRSRVDAAATASAHLWRRCEKAMADATRVGKASHDLARVIDSGGPAAERAVGLEDRKSTRLNSSHLVISYAVFCLKKK